MPTHRLRSLERRAARLEARLGPRPPAGRAGARAAPPGTGTPRPARADWPPASASEHPRARPAQRPPEDNWRTWLLLGGRAAGKTRSAAELVRHWAESGQARRIGLVAATAADYRDTMIEGPSGLLAIAPPWNRPRFEPSKRRLTWPNGAIADLPVGRPARPGPGPPVRPALVRRALRLAVPPAGCGRPCCSASASGPSPG